ncbi:hypothetical protein [Peribacillus sp. NPDC097895]|uniref:hypothetical protein n=1 Tax=Peribacillus sp. NPDC097895 TaxID=3390619 RepID=UPI003D092804
MKKFDFSFIYQYIVNPKTVGAILPSSRYLSNKMIKEINFKDAKYIVEYGPRYWSVYRKDPCTKKSKYNCWGRLLNEGLSLFKT